MRTPRNFGHAATCHFCVSRTMAPSIRADKDEGAMSPDETRPRAHGANEGSASDGSGDDETGGLGNHPCVRVGDPRDGHHGPPE